MHSKVNHLTTTTPTAMEYFDRDILCKFCNTKFMLFAFPILSPAQILEAAILTKICVLRTTLEFKDDITRVRRQENTNDSNLSDNPKLTKRQHQIMSLIVRGDTNQNISSALGISRRTVEAHRAIIMKKTGSKSLPALVGMALATAEIFAWKKAATQNLSSLTPRQRLVMKLVLSGQPSKIIADDLKISQRTVENHRASIMRKTGAKSLSALTCLALAAA